MDLIYNDVCSNEEANTLNTGAVNQCLESVTVMIYLLKQGFKFDSVDDFKLKTAWEQAIQDKNVVPLYEMYELTSNNTEATYYESRNFRKRTQKAIKITDWEAYLGFCSAKALASYQDSVFDRVVEVTEDGDLIGVYAADGIGVTGQLLKQFDVGIRNVATTEKVPFVPITMTYDDYQELEQRAVMVTPDFNPVTSIEGIFDVDITQTALPGSDTLITFTALVGCAGEYVAGLETLFNLLDEAGVDQAATFNDIGNGTYTATGIGLVSGTITTDGPQPLPSFGGLLVEGSGDVTVTA
jgi:hypothetical protein